MQVYLQGGFGEKGRTSVCLQADGTTVMLDAGIKVGATEDTYHPQLAVPAKILDAVVITHAHEDHVGALCWLAGQGFSGPIYMTVETLSETPTTLTQYARPADLAAHPLAAMDIRIVRIETPFSIGSLTINTGHSGHVSGGMWIAATTKSSSVLYCGDVVPNSAVFPMTPLPAANLMLLDAAYGADSVTARQRAVSIAAWIAAQPTGCLLPTPLSGRSLELIAIQQNQFAIEAGMTKAWAPLALLRRQFCKPLPIRRPCYSQATCQTDHPPPLPMNAAKPTGYACRPIPHLTRTSCFGNLWASRVFSGILAVQTTWLTLGNTSTTWTQRSAPAKPIR